MALPPLKFEEIDIGSEFIILSNPGRFYIIFKRYHIPIASCVEEYMRKIKIRICGF